MEILEGKPETIGKKYIISSKGIEGIPNMQAANYTYIGLESEIENNKADIVLPAQEGLSKRHFFVRFDQKMNKYFIKDNLSMGGTYLKLAHPYIISTNTIIAFGEIQMNISIKQNNSVEISQITENPRIYKFNSKQAPITIGRSESCKILIISGGLSRFQCYLDYKDDCWKIIDGSTDGKESTNGTWIFISDEIEINNDEIIKASETIFKFKF